MIVVNSQNLVSKDTFNDGTTLYGLMVVYEISWKGSNSS